MKTLDYFLKTNEHTRTPDARKYMLIDVATNSVLSNAVSYNEIRELLILRKGPPKYLWVAELDEMSPIELKGTCAKCLCPMSVVNGAWECSACHCSEAIEDLFEVRTRILTHS